MKRIRLKSYTLIINLFIAFICFYTGVSYASENPLAPQRMKSPRETVSLFFQEMNQYKADLDAGLSGERHLDNAVRALDLGEIPLVIREQKGREAAIFLKETIDRVLVVNFASVPDIMQVMKNSIETWAFPNTEIILVKIKQGDRIGDFLFSQETVYRAEEFFKKVRTLKYQPGSGNGANYQEPWLERNMPQWSREKTLGLFRWQWIAIFVSILLGFILKSITQFSVQILKKITEKSAAQWDEHLVEIIDRPIGLIVASVFWYFSLNVIRLEGFSLTVLLFLVQGIFSFSTIWLVYRLVDVVSDYLNHVARKTESSLDDQLVPLLAKSLRVFVVVFGGLIAVQNFGVNVMSLLAGLGLGGLAFALAAKDTAANLFGSIMILWDQPFRVGDWIKVPGAEGTVEEIGFRSTRIRTFYDSQVSVPNSQIANVEVDNMGRRKFRRITTVLGVTYNTPPSKIEGFIEGIKNILKTNEWTRKDYFHVVFEGYGSSSLNIMLYFFVMVPDWKQELLARQDVYLSILKLAQELGISFAFPTQTLHIDSIDDVAIKNIP
ncbi:MAG: mechanosensitive ion channel family protein [Bdellovibrionota bacterium]